MKERIETLEKASSVSIAMSDIVVNKDGEGNIIGSTKGHRGADPKQDNETETDQDANTDKDTETENQNNEHQNGEPGDGNVETNARNGDEEDLDDQSIKQIITDSGYDVVGIQREN